MKVVFTGGGTGGHFYPLVAIAEEFNRIVGQEKIVDAKLYFFSDTPYDSRALFDNNMEFRRIPAGKLRIYPSIKNITDLCRTLWGVFEAFMALFSIYPDVVVGKGGYSSFPTLFAARILNIPIIIHESDSVPGRTNRWAAKFAKRIAVSYPEAVKFFPAEKTAYTGQPIRTQVRTPLEEGAAEYLNLDPKIPTILVLGGSQGAEIINETILDTLPTLLKKFQIIHQTGKLNLKNVTDRAGIILGESPLANRYKPVDYLNDLSTRMASGLSSLVVSRAGSAIFEIASWGLPSIIIPITDSHGDHQRENAFNYARSGASVVMEENNLTPNILVREIERLMENPAVREKMSQAAKKFYRGDASGIIAREILSIALSHEK